jgi:hypothetical protein
VASDQVGDRRRLGDLLTPRLVGLFEAAFDLFLLREDPDGLIEGRRLTTDPRD